MGDEPDINKIMAYVSILSFKEIKKNTLDKISSIWLKHKYFGFTPTPTEAKSLKEISNSSSYVTFKRCVGDYEYNAFVKIGFLIYELSEIGEQKRIDEIRRFVYKQHGNFPKKIIQIASTGILEHVLNYLIDLKDDKCLSKLTVREEFEKIVKLWEKVAIPVSNSDRNTKIEKSIKNIVTENKEPIFFVYAAGSACYKAEIVVAKLRNEKLFNGMYFPWCKVRLIGKAIKIEHFLAVFYKVEGGYDTHLVVHDNL